jgi:hypothetical protein
VRMAFLIFLSTSIGLALPRADTDRNARGAQRVSGSDTGLVRVARNATRRFLDVKAASAAGYGRLLACVSGTKEGTMRVYYASGDLINDGELDPEHPEGLVYETQDGRLQLVGVEYLVKVEDWHKNNPLPPTLFGQGFTYNGSPNRYGLPSFYALHVWAWRDDPHGGFADWNQASCEEFTPIS